MAVTVTSFADLSEAAFVAEWGGVYEHSPWVAQAAYREGLTADDAKPAVLAARMAKIVEDSGYERQLALLRLHPELAGKLKIGERLTNESSQEQSSAGLTECSPEEFARFSELNHLYGEQFGFPFIIAVAGLTRGDILSAFETRVGNAQSVEFRTALDQVHKIAGHRLAALARKNFGSAD